MALPEYLHADCVADGTWTFSGTVYLPAGTVNNAAVAANADIAATKLNHMLVPSHTQNCGTDVVSASEPIHVAYGDGTIVAFWVTPDTVPTTVSAACDKQYVVDLQRSTAQGSFASILTSTITIDDSDADKTRYAATLSATTYVTTDIFRVMVTASGSTGNQGQGLVASLVLYEEPAP